MTDVPARRVVADATSRRLLVTGLLVVLLVSGGLRLWDLGSPGEHIFDEVYYAKDARAIVDGRVGPTRDLSWEPGDVVSWPHPDAGKFAIAAGIAVLGDGPLGWRLPAALAGLAVLACVYPLAQRLGLSPWWALAALVLAAADTLGIAQSRIATLDVFVALWTAVTVLCALRYAQDGRRPAWLALAGLAGGLAVATKWSGALALLAAALVVVLPADVWRPGHRADGPRPRQVALAIACLVALPATAYVASYAQYFAAGHSVADWRELQRQMWQFNLNLSTAHSYASAAPTWILDYRPVWYSFADQDGRYFGIVAMGNPLLWWAATLALLAAPLVALKWRVTGLLGPALLVATLYFPWFAASRTSFLYYMTPVAPFLAVLVAAALAAVARGRSTGGGPTRTRPENPVHPDATDARGRRVAAALGTLAFAVAAFSWWPLGRVAEFALWDLPGRVSVLLSLATVGAVGVLAIGVAHALTRRTDVARLRLWCSAAALGAITGIGVAFLPIVLNIGIPPERFYRLIWFPSWI